MLDSDSNLSTTSSCESSRRRSTFYVSLNDHEEGSSSSLEINIERDPRITKSTSKLPSIPAISGLFKSVSGHALEVKTSPAHSGASKNNSTFYDYDLNGSLSGSDKKAKCVTLPTNVSSKMCLDFGRSVNSEPRKRTPLTKPREIALCPQDPPKTSGKLSGLNFIRRTHSTKLNRSPSLLKTLASKCVVENASPEIVQSIVPSPSSRAEESQYLDDEDPGILSGIIFNH